MSGKTASLIIPVYVPPGADGENVLGTAYEPVWAIACALASHDHRILERLPDKANRLPKETSDVIARRWHFDFTVHPERIARAMDLVSFDPRDPAVSRSRRLGLAAAQSYRDEYGHLDVPADYTDPTGYRLGTFITTMRDARTAGRLEADWTAELDALGMIWDKHDAAWRARLAAADYHRVHGHLAAHATTPVGAWLAEQRHLATKNTLAPARAAALTALAADWRLPHGADWHRKYHLLRAHLATGVDPAALTRATLLAGVKIGSWLHRQLTTWPALAPGQQQLMTTLGLTPDTTPLAPRTPRPPHLRTDRPAPGTLPPPRRPRPASPRDHPRRRGDRQDRRLARQSPHQTPLRPAPRDPCPPGRRALRRRLDHRGHRPRTPGLNARLQRGTTRPRMLRQSANRPLKGNRPAVFQQTPVYDRLVAERGDVPVQVRGEADCIHRDLTQVLRQAAISQPSTPQSVFEPKQRPSAL
ncbi:helicase associated domain-containing protein [Streptomyces griseoflavus]|uniref:helicase associated domain-containing protein n=1 Tax=Streptomyces griseoflavus TaxID=35619 RepID=UPI003828DBA1